MKPAPGSLGAWQLAIRPATLPAGAAPVVVGAALAAQAGGFRAGPALAALFGALFIQIGTNFANDVFDFEKGADTSARLGPVRTAQSGLLTPGALKTGMIAAFGLATLTGVYLTLVAGPVIVAIGVASILSGIAYTGGPWPLGYHGLGDLFVMVFFGFVAVCGTCLVQMGSVPTLAWAASAAVGGLSTAILVVNNIRDRETDVVAGKRTLVVRLGRRAGTAEYALMLALAFVAPVIMMVQGALSPVVLLPLLTLPVGLGLLKRVAATEGAALNPVLGQTARLLLLYSALMAVGLVLA